MVNKEKRMNDFRELRNKLDISPTMYADAVAKYTALGIFLNSQGIECEIYPQGSFSLGTVVRPYNKERDVAYDLDFICKIDFDKNTKSPKEIKHIIGKILKSNEVYAEKLGEESDKCWTISYAEVNDIGFNIDIVPAVKEEKVITSELELPPEFIEDTVAITNRKNLDIYSWMTANPKGYKKWFDKINEPFLEYAKIQEKKILTESLKFNKSVEKIPEQRILSALQKAIQILKRNRDVYFCKKGVEKPISAIITTLSALIAEDAPQNLDEIDLLKYIIINLNEKSKFYKNDTKLKFIKNINGKWILNNPVNPQDNLTDSWNDVNANSFFEWINVIESSIIDSFEKDDHNFYLALESYAGAHFVQKNILAESYSLKTPKDLETKATPWSD